MGAEGSKHNTIPIYRFDLGVDDEGETFRAGTEMRSRNLDESRDSHPARRSARCMIIPQARSQCWTKTAASWGISDPQRERTQAERIIRLM